MSCPRDLHYRMPAEWEPHAAAWLSWPHKRESWPGNFEPIPGVWRDLVSVLAAHEDVHILCGGDAVRDNAELLVGGLPSVTLHDVPTDDAWIRDHGPTFLVGPPGAPPALVDWQYNAWGSKYPPFDLDNQVPRRIAEVTSYRRFTVDAVFEGGAVDTNGKGTLLAARTCLLNPNRNPNLQEAEFENLLRDFLGIDHVIWLEAGLAGDDTDGHVDQLARFVAPNVVVAALAEDPQDENYTELQDNFQRLLEARDQDGLALEVVPLPTPPPLYYAEQRLPASYCNFYVANGVVVVPQFGVPQDETAIRLLSPLFPGRECVGLPARELVWGLGAFHCITQQQPSQPSKDV